MTGMTNANNIYNTKNFSGNEAEPEKKKKQLLTGNCTYFVGNLEGRSVQVNDFSTYVQNSAASQVQCLT